MKFPAKSSPIRQRGHIIFRRLAAVALLAAGLALPPLASADLVIEGRFTGGTPPTNMVGRGNLQAIFQAAAKMWENAFKDPDDVWTVQVDYGWGPLGTDSAHFDTTLEDQGGTPHRILRGRITFNNTGASAFFADPTPLTHSEYRAGSTNSVIFDGLELIEGRVLTKPNRQAAGRYDLLTIAAHELGHALGFVNQNTNSKPEPVVTCPRPFAGYKILTDGDHTSLPSSLMAGFKEVGKRYLISALDVLAVAQVSQFAHPHLNPYVNPVPRPGLGRIFVAKKIITMDPARPEATAVGVDRGLIVAVGTPAEVAKAMRGRRFVTDYRFACEVMVPGFVDAHAHFQGYGLYSRVPYLGYYDRVTPDGDVQTGVQTYAAMSERLREVVREQVARTRNTNLPVLAFGADPIFFTNEIPGRHFTAQMLDEINSETPIFLPLLSGHVVACNTPMLNLVMQERDWASVKDGPGVVKDAQGNPTGEFDELEAGAVAFAAFQRKNPLFFPLRAIPALRDAAKLAKRAGVTTATDLAFGASPRSAEEIARLLYAVVTADPDFPVRVVLGYFADQLYLNWPSNAVRHLQEVRRTDTNKLRTGPVKLILDGSIQGYTAQLEAPYLYPELSNSIWNINPGQELYERCLPFWQAGFQFAVHVNGDEATKRMLDVLETLQQQYPKTDHRFSLQHNQVSRAEHFARMARLGATVNLFCNHLYYYGDQHYQITLGQERAEAMDSPAMAKAAGVPFSLHSDAPVTPMQPLTAMWCAVNRVTATGRVLDDTNVSHKISVQDALHAVTLGGAYLLKLEREIGSIEPRKRADFTVLGEDPYDVKPIDIVRIPVRATVFDGTVFPVK